MTAAEARLAALIEARRRRLQPEMMRAYLRAIEQLRQTLTLAEIVQAIESGAVDQLLTDAKLDGVLGGVADQLHDGAKAGFDLARLQTTVTAGLRWNVLNPRVQQALRTLEAQILPDVKAAVRETIRAAVQAGVEAGKNPIAIARTIRDSVGLAPNQLRAVANFENALREGDFRKALGYELRDKRFDATLRRLAASDGTLSSAQIDKMVTAYRRKFEAFHAETVARTATLNAMRTGQHEAFGAAIDAGIIDPNRAQKTWVNTGDSRVRPAHENQPKGVGNETVPYTMPFSNGLQYPSEWNCRCIVRYTQRAA